ncbi:catechol 2,3-dioxygenase-like lactoylglutathione lyase family enzyme [Kribbella steppae]|uniref:Catechol 2,3-dioxygenase-like lactoylglutathione lyase family enzyme n=1 Tax=Kribbella steppae TaxID=2512223 RepID=A0A4R2HQJ2_9ACTN|nr:glyoxalase superfamily protein [Kribbella steppae]TCO32738.1 catechol 2,3-dioxygenase-like lactoylglutathione lyase family enzyme [Kribbella steppae]
MDWKLELVIVPVTDVDRAKKFYTDQLGFAEDVDHSAGDSFRVVQLTPPGSACSITIGTGLTTAAPGSYQGTHLVVKDIEAARAELVERGVEVSEPFHFTAEGQQPGVDPNRAKYGTYLTFSDPDGNGWTVQEVPEPTPDRQ